MLPMLAVLTLALGTAFASAAENEVKAVFIKDNNVFIELSRNREFQLTHTSTPKYLPVWSADGQRVAFIQQAPDDVAMADLFVVSETGVIQRRVRFRPYEEGVVTMGMRFVESLEWVAPSRIAVSGSLNPSTAETVVIDLDSGKEVIDFFDDGVRAAFSPDGRHFAYTDGSPHFTPREFSFPTLRVDGAAVYPRHGEKVEFSSSPEWSPDGKKVAVVARVAGSNVQVLTYSPQANSIQTMPVSSDAAESASIEWIDGGVYLFKNGRIVARAGVAPASASEIGAAQIRYNTSRDQKKTLFQKVRLAGGEYPDFWCSSCALAGLPRRVSLSPLGD